MSNIHEFRTEVKCELCDKKLSSQSALKQHVELTHERVDTMYFCDICNYQFRWKGHLKRHKLDIHVTEVKCELCDKTFSSKKFKQHIKSRHEKVLIMHPCDICNYQSKQKGHLKRHKLARHYTE